MPTQRGGEHVYNGLRAAGIDLLVGIPGTQTLPLDRTVAERDEMRYLMARHETAVPHIAWGYHEAGGGIAATLTVPGPGDTNAMHGLKNALEDCVPLLHVSAEVDPADRGRSPIHEIEADTVDNAVKANHLVERPREVRPAIDRGLAEATTPPTGPVRVGVPSGLLAAEVDSMPASIEPETVRHETTQAYSAAADLIAGADRPLVYIGGGLRRADDGSAAAASLIETLGVPFVTSYKGKGVLPEDRPEWLGTTASHLNAGARRALDAADVVIALGTNFDGVTTDSWSLPMGDSLIHVNVDPSVFDRAYEADVAIADDAAHAAYELVARVEGAGTWDGRRVGPAIREEYLETLDEADLLGESAPARTPAVLRALRDHVPPETVVVTDVGGFRLWALQLFEAAGPERYVTAGSWAGMGVGVPAAIGARVANPETPVLCLTGDGGLLMCVHELHTAADEGIDLTVVVFDNADYGTISKSPEIADYGGGRQFAWEAPDYTQVAEGFGCRGTVAETPTAVADTVTDRLDRTGVDLVSVPIDPDERGVAAAADYESTVDL
ncbi:MAG: thiamine pyrophosphate-binding protein [Halobacteriaceae archaeon]